MIKMIVLDLDGTLLTDKQKVTKETKEYLLSLKRKEYIIVIALVVILYLVYLQ